MKTFGGTVLFLDRDDINTDELIPARYLTEATKAALKPFLLEDLELPGFDPRRDIAGKAAVVTKANFGCGSSREHAPWALEVNGINLVVAEGFARIFRQNMFNCGLLAITLPKSDLEAVFGAFAGKEAAVSVDLESKRLTFASASTTRAFAFEADPFDLELARAGGWVEYADRKY
jgi:3-isopropylmalate/(R)-2-methylmalate dehydratase small subunit